MSLPPDVLRAIARRANARTAAVIATTGRAGRDAAQDTARRRADAAVRLGRRWLDRARASLVYRREFLDHFLNLAFAAVTLVREAIVASIDPRTGAIDPSRAWAAMLRSHRRVAAGFGVSSRVFGVTDVYPDADVEQECLHCVTFDLDDDTDRWCTIQLRGRSFSVGVYYEHEYAVDLAAGRGAVRAAAGDRRAAAVRLVRGPYSLITGPRDDHGLPPEAVMRSAVDSAVREALARYG